MEQIRENKLRYLRQLAEACERNELPNQAAEYRKEIADMCGKSYDVAYTPAPVPVLIMGELVDHRPCGVSVIRVKQDGVWHKIGVDRTSLRKATVNDVMFTGWGAGATVPVVVKQTELKTV